MDVRQELERLGVPLADGGKAIGRPWFYEMGEWKVIEGRNRCRMTLRLDWCEIIVYRGGDTWFYRVTFDRSGVLTDGQGFADVDAAIAGAWAVARATRLWEAA